MEKRTKNMDLTNGVVWKQLLVYFWPMLLGSLLQQLYTTADAVIVGQFTGKAGLAAIDSVMSMLRIPVSFFVGLSTGATIIISQYFGAKNDRDLEKAVHTAVTFACLAGVAVSVIGFIAAPFCVSLLEVPGDISAMSVEYVKIYCGGLFLSLLYNIGAGILRAVGNSRTPFYVLAVAGAVNVGLDILFVGFMDMGPMGAALATVISQGLSSVLVVHALMKAEDSLRLSLKKLRIEPRVMKMIFSVGLPIALQSALYPITNMLIQASVNATGTDNIAAWALVGKLDLIIWLTMDALSSAVSTFVAQNYGAGLYKRAKKGVNTGFVMLSAIIIVLSVILLIWCVPLGKLFLNKADADIAYIASGLMKLLAPAYITYVPCSILASAIRGTGESFWTMIITLAGVCVVRVFWVLVIIPMDNSLITILWSYPISWVATSVVFVIYYMFFKKRKLDIEDTFKGKEAQ